MVGTKLKMNILFFLLMFYGTMHVIYFIPVFFKLMDSMPIHHGNGDTLEALVRSSRIMRSDSTTAVLVHNSVIAHNAKDSQNLQENRIQKYIQEDEQRCGDEILNAMNTKNDEMGMIDFRRGIDPVPPSEVYVSSESDDNTPATVVTTTTLNLPNSFFYPIYTDGCCGIGHRLCRNIPTLVFANQQKRHVKIWWADVPWSTLFKETDYVTQGGRGKGLALAKKRKLYFANSFPGAWTGGSNTTVHHRRHHVTTLDRYGEIEDLFDNQHAVATMVLLRDALSSLVLSFLNPIRAQLNHVRNNNSNNSIQNHISICIHIREGNNETGDWQRKKERHISLESVLVSTRNAIQSLILSPRNVTHASIYVASDNPLVRLWFQENSPCEWTIIKPGKLNPMPEQGVWFGEHGSSTNHQLNSDQRNEAMAAALAEVFALGECDALMIPNYSSFTCVAITLSKARGVPIFFGKKDGDNFEYHEMETLYK